jgi:isopentenyl phosphate kinase
MSKKLVVIKLGGGLIAPKDWPAETPDCPVIERLIREIKQAGVKTVMVVGSGNFGHAGVKKYGIDSPEGVNKVRGIAQKIGKIVAIRIKSSQLIVTHKRPWGIGKILNADKTPVIYGDVMGIGKIWSGEKIIEMMFPELLAGGWKVERIIQVSREDGVWNGIGKIIPEINKLNWQKVKNEIVTAAAIDVTGGMLHKVEESLAIAKKYKVETLIMNGGVTGRLRKVLEAETIIGTRIN